MVLRLTLGFVIKMKLKMISTVVWEVFVGGDLSTFTWQLSVLEKVSNDGISIYEGQ